jgi:hypothetical protein
MKRHPYLLGLSLAQLAERPDAALAGLNLFQMQSRGEIP